MDALNEYTLLGGFLVVGLVIGVAPILVPHLIAPRGVREKTLETYECGVDTIGSAWIRFSISYYLFALIFVAFEVDILYLFPVALVYGDSAFVWRDLIEVAIFLLILSMALLHAWRKGIFRWE